MKLRALYLEETSRHFFTRPNQVTTWCSDVVFLSYERIVVFLDGYHPVDLTAEKVGNVKDFFYGKRVVEPLDAEIVYLRKSHLITFQGRNLSLKLSNHS